MFQILYLIWVLSSKVVHITPLVLRNIHQLFNWSADPFYSSGCKELFTRPLASLFTIFLLPFSGVVHFERICSTYKGRIYSTQPIHSDLIEPNCYCLVFEEHNLYGNDYNKVKDFTLGGILFNTFISLEFEFNLVF